WAASWVASWLSRSPRPFAPSCPATSGRFERQNNRRPLLCDLSSVRSKPFNNWLVSVALMFLSSPLWAQNAVKPGLFHVGHPTLLNLGFEWSIEGDANRNATVAVQFRHVGEADWRQGLPLLRIGGEKVYRRRENLDYTVPRGFAGSILNLQPGTE